MIVAVRYALLLMREERQRFYVSPAGGTGQGLEVVVPNIWWKEKGRKKKKKKKNALNSAGKDVATNTQHIRIYLKVSSSVLPRPFLLFLSFVRSSYRSFFTCLECLGRPLSNILSEVTKVVPFSSSFS
jgi:hypothetical protein